MILSKSQYDRLPENYKQHFIQNGGEFFGEYTVNDGRKSPIDNPYQRGMSLRRNIHP